jgi:molybdate transport system regulatory protein
LARVRLRIYLGEGEHKLGPGKVQLLEAIRERGSISAAARSMGMAYRHAWDLVDDLNRCFESPVVTASTGGREGGGARLTALGEELIRRFREMEESTRRSIAPALAALDAKLAPGPRGGGSRGRGRSSRSG